MGAVIAFPSRPKPVKSAIFDSVREAAVLAAIRNGFSRATPAVDPETVEILKILRRIDRRLASLHKLS